MKNNKRVYCPSRWLSIALITIGLTTFCQASYLQGKAWLAQRLLENAWRAETPSKPWPWADITPVAKLVVPKLDIEQIVLGGFSGEALAFGPGMEQIGNAYLIAGHRDSHFAFLRDLETGDRIWLEHSNGKTGEYSITDFEVIDTRTHPAIQPHNGGVVLSTCYPFDEWQAGGPLRYVVSATPAIESLAF